jgi:two-component system, sensor histidine kinase
VAGGQTKADPLSQGTIEPRLFEGRILVVEDVRVNQRVITLMLERLGLHCHDVEDGLTALDILRQGNWDLVFMDCQLPGLNGFETTRQAIALLDRRTPPIIALTANVRPEDREACRAAGMVDFLAKPVRVDGLRSCLARWLHQHG